MTLQTGFVLVAMLPFRSDGIIPHAATASLAGWPDTPEACLQSHPLLSYLLAGVGCLAAFLGYLQDAYPVYHISSAKLEYGSIEIPCPFQLIGCPDATV